MSDSDVAWMRICKRVWNKKFETGTDGICWCPDDQKDFLRSVEPELNSSNMLLTDCINHIKSWFSTRCTENGSMKLPEDGDDDDDSIVNESGIEEELEETQNPTKAVVTNKGTVEEWQPRMHQKVLAPFPIDNNPCSTMVGRRMESSVMRDRIHTRQDFPAMVVYVDKNSKTVGLNYYGIGGYHPSVCWSVLKLMTGNSAEGVREKQPGKRLEVCPSEGRVVTMSTNECNDDLNSKLKEFAADRKKELEALKDEMSEMKHEMNGMQKEVNSTGLVMHGITKDVADIKKRMKALMDKALKGNEIANMGGEKSIKDLQQSVASHEQKLDDVQVKIDTEVKRVEDMVTALSATASTAESHRECLTRLEQMEKLVVGTKRKLDSIYSAITTMAELENDVEKDTDSDKHDSSVQIGEDKPEEELDGPRSPQLARRRGGGGGGGGGGGVVRGRGGGRGRGRGAAVMRDSVL